jgi:hypothetical protein
VVVEIAKNHGKTPGNVLLRYIIQNGIAVIPKSTNPARIKENFDVNCFFIYCYIFNYVFKCVIFSSGLKNVEQERSHDH